MRGVPRAIDAVVTWVDASDPAYAARRAAEGARRGIALDHNTRACQDRPELRYCLRSLAAFAPWLRRVYLVTDRQWPPWLDERAAAAGTPPIVRVDHAAIHPSGRSAYGSIAIEAIVHRIRGLSHRFLFLNSDTMLARPAAMRDLFDARGRIRYRVDAERVQWDAEPMREAAHAASHASQAAHAKWRNHCVLAQAALHARTVGLPRGTLVPQGTHQMHVWCKGCIRRVIAQHRRLWWRTCHAFGRAPPFAGRFLYELMAVHRGHAVSEYSPADGHMVDAPKLPSGRFAVPPAALFLCVNNIDCIEDAGRRARMLRTLDELLPDALECELRIATAIEA